MCTVTFIPLKEGFVLTSSRDEKIFRSTRKPMLYKQMGNTLVYPKDELAGGTWIAMSSNKQIACLLNGGFENHKKELNYRISRGAILLESFNFSSHGDFLKNLYLEGIEPFTLLLLNYQEGLDFKELVWDGEKKHIHDLDKSIPKIWSSATLYSQENRKLRTKWFENWLDKYGEETDCDVLKFHLGNHSSDSENDILMKRENDLQTLSISQFRLDDQGTYFIYHDLIDGQNEKIDLNNL